MTWKDKLDIGLKEDAPDRKDNVPPNESGAQAPAEPTERPARLKPYRVVPVRAASKPKE